MLHYVRGDGGMVVVPVEELKRWIEDHEQVDHGQLWIDSEKLKAELEAMGK